MKAGQRYRSQSTTAEIIVIRGSDKEIELTCAGENMVGVEAGSRPSLPSSPQSGDGGDEMLLLGKRYVDEETGVEVLCTAAGTGPLSVNGRTLTMVAPKLLPSSD